MRRAWTVVLAGVVGWGAVGVAWAGPGEIAAATSLRDSAIEGYYAPSGNPGQALEIAVQARLAARLAPADAPTHWLLATLYEQQGRGIEADRSEQQKLAAEAWGVYLAVYPNDFVAQLRYLGARIALCPTLEDKLTLTGGVLRDTKYSPAARAEAAVLLADLHRGRGRAAATQKALLQAIALDGTHGAALQQWLAMQPQAAPADRLDVYLRILRGAPFAVESAAAAGMELDAEGLHGEAVIFYAHAWELLGQWGARKAIPALAYEYAGALLSAGRSAQAVEILKELATNSPDDPGVRLALAEAHRSAGDPRSARRQTSALFGLLEKIAAETPSADPLGQVAWYMVMAGRSGKAPVQYASKALESDPKNETLQAILAAALVRSGDIEAVKAAVETLQRLSQTDSFAAVMLAEYFRSRGASGSARQAITRGLARSRRGPVARRLEALAAQEEMHVVTGPQARMMLTLLKALDLRYLESARRPEKFLTIELSAEAPRVAIGQPLMLTATLSNRSDLPMPMGQWGAAGPVDVRMPAIGLTARCALGAQKTFSSGQMVPAVWPAPRSLAPGASVATVVRVDIGPLRRGLNQRPFDDVQVTVSGVALPLMADSDDKRMLPTLGVPELTITRVGLLGEFDRNDPAAWRKALGNLMARLQDAPGKRSLAERLIAARQAALLLAATQGGGDRLPRQLSGQPIAKQAMYVASLLLHDKEPAVRAEMAAALDGCASDAAVRDELLKLIKDPSVVVRVRVAQVLCRVDASLAARFADDAESLVRWMASGAAAGAAATSQPATAPVR